MVYHHSSVQCPHCKKWSSRPTTTNNQVLYGSPFRRCLKCGQPYVDKAYKEKAIVEFNEPPYLPFMSYIWCVILTGLSVMFIEGFFEGPAPIALYIFSIAIIIAAVFLDIAVVKSFYNMFHKDKFLQNKISFLSGDSSNFDEETSLSLKRLSSKEYLDALRSCGIDVPEFFYSRINCSKPQE